MNQMMNHTKSKLMEAERLAAELFWEVESRALIIPGKRESDLNRDIYQLAGALFGINKFWHKRVEFAWHEATHWFDYQTSLSGAAFYEYITGLEPGNYSLYVYPGNPNDMFFPDARGNKKEWILEIHFVNREKQIGGFFEQLLT